MRWRRQAGMAILALAIAGGTLAARSDTALVIGVKDRANANATVAATGSFVGLVWSARAKDGVTDIYSATSRDAGRTFSTPIRVNHLAGEASASGEQPPRIALISRAAADPAIVVLWTAKAANGTRLVSARSIDGGRSFTQAESIPGSHASGNRGWESMAIGANGEPVAVWLDHRDVPTRTAANGASSGEHQHGASSHQPATDGVTRAQLSQIYFARLSEPSSARAIAPGVCYCCKTSVATGPDGAIVAAWRHVYEGNIRDIALTKSTDGGRTFAPPVRVSTDDWELDGCPENGPSVAVDRSNVIHVVWPTLVPGAAGAEPTLALFYATSKDGQTFTARQPLPTDGFPRHPQIAIGPTGTILVAWDEQLTGVRRVAMARASGQNQPARFARETLTDAAGTYPAIAPLSDGGLVVWTSGPVAETRLRVERRVF